MTRKCKVCNTEWIKFNPMMFISLSIKKYYNMIDEKKVSIHDVIKDFLEEQLYKSLK